MNSIRFGSGPKFFGGHSVVISVFCLLSSAVASGLESYHVTFDACSERSSEGAEWIGLRQWQNDSHSWRWLVNPETLETKIRSADHLNCRALTPHEWSQSTSRYANLLRHQKQEGVNPINAGLHRPSRDNKGSFLTIDLCPSSKSLDQSFFETLMVKTAGAPAVNLAVSGRWIERHQNDFDWLLQQDRKGSLAIQWLNHSYRHPYIKGVADLRNFLLLPDVNFEEEVLTTEQILLSQGVVPTIYFRFPGLVASPALMKRISDFGLVAVGADAWLGKGEQPVGGSIILLHGNGNEPKGLSLFLKMLDLGKIAQPYRGINSFQL